MSGQCDEFAPPHGAYPKARDHGLTIAGLERVGGVRRNKKRRVHFRFGSKAALAIEAGRGSISAVVQKRTFANTVLWFEQGVWQPAVCALRCTQHHTESH